VRFEPTHHKVVQSQELRFLDGVVGCGGGGGFWGKQKKRPLRLPAKKKKDWDCMVRRHYKKDKAAVAEKEGKGDPQPVLPLNCHKVVFRLSEEGRTYWSSSHSNRKREKTEKMQCGCQLPFELDLGRLQEKEKKAVGPAQRCIVKRRGKGED